MVIKVVPESNSIMCLGKEMLTSGSEEFLMEEYCASPHEADHVTSQLILLLGSLCVGGAVNYLLHKIHFKFLPESGVLIILGAISGGIIFAMEGELARNVIVFNNDIFLFALLPPIIFESAYTMRQQTMIKNLDAIMMHAVPGTIIAAVSFGGLLYLASSSLSTEHSLTLAECLSFGSLIAATDPIATLATFGSLGVNKNLEIVISGEATVNDAVAIILFDTFNKLVTREVVTAGEAIGSFFSLMIGSSLIGLVVGVAASLVFKYVHFGNGHHNIETAAFIGITWSAVVWAETAHMSGIIALLMCGLICEHYTYRNLSPASKIQTVGVYKQLSVIADSTIYFLVGFISIVQWNGFNVKVTFFCLFLMLISRMFTVFPLNFIVNMWRGVERKIPFAHSVMMWWAGLRGAIAVSLALTFPSINRQMFISTTLFLTMITVFINGAFTGKVLEVLKIETGQEYAMKAEAYHTDEALAALTGWRKIDNLYIKRVLLRPSAYRTLKANPTSPKSGDIELKPTMSDIYSPATTRRRASTFMIGSHGMHQVVFLQDAPEGQPEPAVVSQVDHANFNPTNAST